MDGLGSYCASKAAVNLLTKTAARENPGIRVNAVSPGMFQDQYESIGKMKRLIKMVRGDGDPHG